MRYPLIISMLLLALPTFSQQEPDTTFRNDTIIITIFQPCEDRTRQQIRQDARTERTRLRNENKEDKRKAKIALIAEKNRNSEAEKMLRNENKAEKNRNQEAELQLRNQNKEDRRLANITIKELRNENKVSRRETAVVKKELNNENKKSRMWFWVAMGVLAVLALSLIIWFRLKSKK